VVAAAGGRPRHTAAIRIDTSWQPQPATAAMPSATAAGHGRPWRCLSGTARFTA